MAMSSLPPGITIELARLMKLPWIIDSRYGKSTPRGFLKRMTTIDSSGVGIHRAMNGFDVLSSLRSRHITAPAILITSRSDETLVKRAVAAGFAQVVEAFGPDVVAADGTIDRRTLATRVFSDPDVDTRPFSSNAKMLAVMSLVCWLGAITAGRLLAYVGSSTGL